MKSHQTCIYSKIKKNQTLCGTDWHRWISFWFVFCVYAGLVTFHYQVFCCIFLSICRFCALVASKCCVFWVYAGLVNLKSLKPAYTQKNNKIDSKKSPNLHILKKIKNIKKNQTLCGSDWHRWISFLFYFFEFMQVLCTFGIKMLIFLSICRFGELQVPQTCIYSKKNKNFDTEKSPKLHILKKTKKTKKSDSMWDWLA